jgi:protein arginine kinase
MTKSGKLPNIFTSKMPWSKATNSIWPLTLFHLRRNLDRRLFPEKLSAKEANELLEEIKKPLSSYLTLPSAHLTPHEKELLFEHFMLTEQFEKLETGRAFILNDTGQFLGLINLEDHLHLHLLSFEKDFQTPFATLSNLEKTLAKDLRFSYSPRFGYLTSDPAFCGTGLVIQVFLHLPALLHLEKFPEAIEKLSSDISLKGLGSEGTYLGDFVLIENKYTLGVSEESILKSVYDAATLLSEKEESLRKNIKKPELFDLKNKISRSFGLLKEAYSIQTEEALSALSIMHLGKELDLVISKKSFNFFDLFFSCGRAHLSELSKNKKGTKENLALLRADYLRKEISLMDISLKNLYN